MNTRSPPRSRLQTMVDRAIEIAEDPKYGYSQKPPSGRWGPDYDCSSLMYEIANYAGYPVGTGGEKVRFTGTMLKDFEKAGFQILPFANVGVSDLQIGDVLLNLALHAEVYIGNGETVGATSSEDGTYIGEAGDQTGTEIEKHPVLTFNKGWDYVLRPPNDIDDNDDDEIEKEGEEEMPMNYGPTPMSQTQPYMSNGQPWNNMNYPQGGMSGNMQGYNPNNRMMPNQSGMQGYPQGNLGQMNGYSQANAGYPQNNQMPMGLQGTPNDLCFVMGIEGAKNGMGTPNGRDVCFDEDKMIMYIRSFDQQGRVNDIHVYSFEECSEEMPQHLSPLMRNNQNGNTSMGMNTPVGDFITRAEFEELKEMISGESSNEQRSSGTASTNGRRNGGQQSGSKLNARTN